MNQLRFSVATWLATLAVLPLAACGSAPPPEAPPAPPAATAAPTALPLPLRRPASELAASQVYDAAGRASACARPPPSCPPSTPDHAFLERCRMAGYNVRGCGCDLRCSGDVSGPVRRWSASGAAVECSPAKADCTPPSPGAAFQDACAEKGHRLEVCGCEWLCTGNPTAVR